METIPQTPPKETETKKPGYKYLPAYTQFIRDHHLEEYVTTLLALSKNSGVPVLKHFDSYSEEQLLDVSRKSSFEFLTWLAENKTTQQIKEAIHKWKQNKLPLLGQVQITLADLTLISYTKRKTLTSLLPLYTTDFMQAVMVLNDLEDYFKEADTAYSNTYIDLLFRQVQKNETLYKQAQERAHIGNFVWNLQTNDVFWSDELYRIYGLDPNGEKITYKKYTDMLRIEDKAVLLQNIEQTIFTGNPLDFNFHITTNEGIEKILNIKADLEKDREGYPQAFVGTIQDITYQQQLINKLQKNEEELQQKNKELEASNNNLQEFAYVASHDLKEPLRKISTFGEMLFQFTNNDLSDKEKFYVERMIEGSKRMQYMIDELLSFAVISRNKSFEKTNLNDVLKKTLADLEVTINEKDAIITASNLPLVNVVTSQFEQLFLNLISNSLKFSRDGVRPVIKINHYELNSKEISQKSLSPRKRYLNISIEDNGIGFEPEYAAKIFGMFQRLHGKVDYEGSGIGLSICKKIMEHHGGNINATGKPNEGATFDIILPISS